MGIKLNTKQQLFVKEYELFMKSKREEAYLLIGPAGSGKTFCLKEAIKNERGVIGATISHAAKNILQRSLGNDTKCYTIAKLLGLQMKVTEEGEITFVPSKKKNAHYPIDFARVVIVDECSMISKEIHSMIMDRKPYGCKIIFVGDRKQLPSVGEDTDSVTFGYHGVELDETMRFQGSIQVLTDAVRDEIEKLTAGIAANKYIINTLSQRKDMLNPDSTGVKFKSNIREMVDLASDYFRNSNDPNILRILAFKNKSINTLNTAIRMNLYGENAPAFVPGELVITNGGYKEIFNNGEVLRIQEIKHWKHLNIPCLAVKITNRKTITPIFVINPDPSDPGYKMFQEHAKDLSQRAKQAPPNLKSFFWKNYFDFLGEFAKFDYAYAVNCYKSQGATYQNVIVMEEEIMGIKPLNLKQKFQALYVSMTRAQRNLYIYNKKY